MVLLFSADKKKIRFCNGYSCFGRKYLVIMLLYGVFLKL